MKILKRDNVFPIIIGILTIGILVSIIVGLISGAILFKDGVFALIMFAIIILLLIPTFK